MVREFFKADGRPESKHDKSLRTKVEQAFRNEVRAAELPESAKEYAQILEQFPHEWLNGIFRHLYERTRAGEFKDLIGGQGSIEWNDDIEKLAEHSPIANIIRINPTGLEKKTQKAAEYGLDEALARKLLLARVFIHEAVHAYSKISAKGLELFRNRKQGKLVVTSGLETQHYSFSGGKENNPTDEPIDSRDFNEGLIDFLAEEIFIRYLQREGLANSPQTAQFQEFFTKAVDGYKNHKDFILDVIYTISEDTGVSPQIAYEGLIHQLHSEGTLNEELAAWMADMVGEEKFKRIKEGTLFNQPTEGM